MIQTDTTRTAPGRLLLKLSARRDAELMLPLASELGAAFGMELSALFVEEQETVAACALPISNIVGFSGQPVAATAQAVEDALRREAESCEALVRRTAELARLAWSFRTERGGSLALLRALHGAGDIVAVHFDRLGGGWREAIRLAGQLLPGTGGVLVLKDGPRSAGDMVVIGGAGGPAPRSLEFAARAARGARIVELAAPALASGAVSAPGHPRLVVTDPQLLTASETEMARLMDRLRAPLLVLS